MHFSNFLDLFEAIQTLTVMDRSFFIFVLWSIWLYMNAVVMGNEYISIIKTISVVESLMDASKNYEDYSQTLINPILQQKTWYSTPPDCLKVKVDASFVEEDAVAGILIRDSKSNLIMAKSVRLGTLMSAELVELMAIRLGIIESLKININNVEVESDSMFCIARIDTTSVDLTTLGALANEIKDLGSLFVNVKFSHINKTENVSAHLLTKLTLKGDCHWGQSLPSFATTAINADLS